MKIMFRASFLFLMPISCGEKKGKSENRITTGIRLQTCLTVRVFSKKWNSNFFFVFLKCNSLVALLSENFWAIIEFNIEA
jgi:hypothetical protein